MADFTLLDSKEQVLVRRLRILTRMRRTQKLAMFSDQAIVRVATTLKSWWRRRRPRALLWFAGLTEREARAYRKLSRRAPLIAWCDARLTETRKSLGWQ